jgi:hypothetical protein
VSRERAYARAALDGCAEELVKATPRERNDILNKKAFRLGTMVARRWVSAAEVFDALLAAADACMWWPAWFRMREMWGDVAPDTITFEMVAMAGRP